MTFLIATSGLYNFYIEILYISKTLRDVECLKDKPSWCCDTGICAKALGCFKSIERTCVIFWSFMFLVLAQQLVVCFHCQFSFIIYCSKKLLLNSTDPTGPQITLFHGKLRRIMVHEHCVVCLVFSTSSMNLRFQGKKY